MVAARRAVGIVLVLLLLVVPYFPVGAWPLPNTGSMEPTMSGCDVVIYAPAGEVDVGDVVIAEAPWQAGAVVHRIVEETPSGYVLQGDANAAPDPMAVSSDRFVARVHYAVRTGTALEPVCDPASDIGVTAYRRYHDLVSTVRADSSFAAMAAANR